MSEEKILADCGHVLLRGATACNECEAIMRRDEAMKPRAWEPQSLSSTLPVSERREMLDATIRRAQVHAEECRLNLLMAEAQVRLLIEERRKC